MSTSWTADERDQAFMGFSGEAGKPATSHKFKCENHFQ